MSLALLAGGLALVEVEGVAGAIAARRPLVALWSGVLGGLPLALMFLAAAILLVASLGQGRAQRTAKPAMVLIAVAFIAAFVAPGLGRAMVGEVLVRRGYVRCPAIHERPVARARWAASAVICPAGVP